MTPTFAFAAYPYIALAVFCFGILLRFLLVQRQITTVKAKLQEVWAVLDGSKLWCIGTALLLLGHLIGTAFPRQILSWDKNTIRLYVLEGLLFAIGVVTLASCVGLIWRYLKVSDDSLAVEVATAAFLATTFVALLSGLLMSAFYRWGSFWGVVTLRPYAVSLLQGAPAPKFAMQMPFLVRLHIFSSFTLFALVPFTRLASFAVLALHWVTRRMSKSAAEFGDALGMWLQRYAPTTWIWPEED